MFRVGHAHAEHWRDAVNACLEMIGTVPPAASLGFVYLSDRLAPHAKRILAHLRTETGLDAWVGSVGIGVLANDTEYFDEPALVVMIADLPEGEFSVFSGRSRAPLLGARSASGAAAAHFAIVHGDPATEDMQELIADMSRKVESGFLVGGLSSSRAETLQIANEVLQGGLSGVVLSARVPIVTRLTQGCSPLPGRHVITEAERNVIVTIDGRPALDVFREAAGDLLARDLARAAQHLLAGLPVPGSDTGDYLVRNIIGFDPANKLIAIAAHVEAGMPFLFCRRGGAAAREDLEGMLDSIAAGIEGTPRGGLYFTCISRGAHMFGEESVEARMIRERLGDFPLVGFYSNGEISHNRLYGYTGVLALFL